MMFNRKEYMREWAKKNKDKIKEQKRKWREENKDKSNEYQRKWRNENKDLCKEIFKRYKYKNADAFNKRNEEYARKWSALNPDKVKASRERRKELIRKYQVEKYNIDPMTNLRCRIRARLREMFRSAKPTSTSKMLGCTFQELKHHIESKFLDGMSWDNKDKWHIDHIVPLSSATSESEISMLAHYTNLQPLWAKDNLSKNDSTEHLSSPWPRKQ